MKKVVIAIGPVVGLFLLLGLAQLPASESGDVLVIRGKWLRPMHDITVQLVLVNEESRTILFLDGLPDTMTPTSVHG